MQPHLKKCFDNIKSLKIAKVGNPVRNRKHITLFVCMVALESSVCITKFSNNITLSAFDYSTHLDEPGKEVFIDLTICLLLPAWAFNFRGKTFNSKK